MKSAVASFLLLALMGAPRSTVRADEKEVKAILDKAVAAIGGEEKLGKVKAFSWKAKGTFSFMGNDNAVTLQATVQGLDHYRQELEGNFGGNAFKAINVLNGDKGYRDFGGNRSDLEGEALANLKRTVYLGVIPITALPLREKGFKAETIADEKIGDKPAAGLKVTGPEGKDFKIYFDKETGLPVRTVARVAFMGNEFTQETNFSEYKEMAGIKKATKLTAKRDGEKFQEITITEFKVLETVDPKTFSE